MRLFNTLTKKKEEFRPLSGSRVNLFVCGPTVYDHPHIGNLKTYTQFDFIVKYLRSRGYEVFYLQNITDLDDKVIKRAKELNLGWRELTKKFTAVYLDYMAQLHNDAVSEYANATDFIPQIVSQVKTLVDKGYAYRISDGYYFEISKFADYGKLSGRTELKEEDAVTRIDASSEKRGWNDFCLWKFSKEGEPSWETDLGSGRPGWHIEDTAITEHYFGPQYDVHGGAVDLIIPHHEAEIAQMESASGKSPLVRYWLHTAFLNMSNQKMSKSKGNFLTVADVLKNYDYRTLRYLFISNHYRTQINFSDESLEQSKNALQRINEFTNGCKENENTDDEGQLVAELKSAITEALDDDFDTPKALARLFEFIRERNKDHRAGQLTREYLTSLNEFFDFMQFGEVKRPVDAEVENLFAQREKYRLARDFAKADEIRGQLKALGVDVTDNALK